MKEPEMIDAEYRVVEPPYSWRIRFWPSVLFWVATSAIFGVASTNLPTADKGEVAAFILGAALISPVIRFICSVLWSSTDPVDEEPAQQLRQRLSRRAGSRRVS